LNDLVVAHLHAPLGDVERLDLLFDDVTKGARWRVIADYTFNHSPYDGP
jgi:hypothetical protein